MDQKLTESLQKWLATPKEQRDYEQGNIYLFRLCGNKIQYRNLATNPARHAEFISRQIQKYVNFRVREFTHDQVKQMELRSRRLLRNASLLRSPIRRMTSKRANGPTTIRSPRRFNRSMSRTWALPSGCAMCRRGSDCYLPRSHHAPTASATPSCRS